MKMVPVFNIWAPKENQKQQHRNKSKSENKEKNVYPSTVTPFSLLVHGNE